jgi:hypothetical protein
MEDRMSQLSPRPAPRATLLAAGVGCLALLIAVALPRAQAQPKVAPAATGPVLFKNLQVLPKEITKAELKATMKGYSKALGVDCEFCHKEPDMDFDTPKKKVAREMMTLTKEVNVKYRSSLGKKNVSCFTCHRGQKEPAEPPTTAGGK